MGFVEEAHLWLKTPIFPFINLLDGKRIALYGVQPIGADYRRQIQKWDIGQIVLWVDENWAEYARAGLEVSPVERLLEADYDCVVIAAADRASADGIQQKLSLMGIENSRVLWRAPLAL